MYFEIERDISWNAGCVASRRVSIDLPLLSLERWPPFAANDRRKSPEGYLKVLGKGAVEGDLLILVKGASLEWLDWVVVYEGECDGIVLCLVIWRCRV